jgi:nitroreductase
MGERAPGAIEAMLSRRSVPALRLHEPGPSSAQIDVALDAALCAPDHGALRPWRFVLIHGVAREHLAGLLAARMQEREPDTVPGKIERLRTQVRTAPLVIAVGARIEPTHKVPEIEQLLSVGAGVMNLLKRFMLKGTARSG